MPINYKVPNPLLGTLSQFHLQYIQIILAWVLKVSLNFLHILWWKKSLHTVIMEVIMDYGGLFKPNWCADCHTKHALYSKWTILKTVFVLIVTKYQFFSSWDHFFLWGHFMQDNAVTLHKMLLFTLNLVQMCSSFSLTFSFYLSPLVWLTYRFCLLWL